MLWFLHFLSFVLEKNSGASVGPDQLTANASQLVWVGSNRINRIELKIQMVQMYTNQEEGGRDEKQEVNGQRKSEMLKKK